MIFNRNLHVAVLVAAMMTLGARASLVTSNDVVGAVSVWAAANGAAFGDVGTAVAATPTYDDKDGTTVLYWTVKMSKGGAVIASPDSELDPVIAFLEKYDGAFPEGHPFPSILKGDLRNRLSIIRGHGALERVRFGVCTAARATGTAPQPDEPSNGSKGSEPIPDEVKASMTAANAQWAKYGVQSAGGRALLKAASLEGGDASPYVRRIVDGFESGGRYTHWNQSGGIYNCKTPKNEVCGCVATAGAAILQFFNCMTNIGVVKSSVGCKLYGGSYDCSTEAGDLDWSLLPASYGGESTAALDDTGRAILGRATYNVGVLVGMSWASEGPGSESGAYVQNLTKVFKSYGFKTSRHVAYSGGETTDGKEFVKTLYAQVWCGAPVVLGISSESGGHAVIGCGYARDTDGSEFCRVFMGWGGSGDGWYNLPTIRDFNVVDEAVTMIGYEDDAVVPVYGETNIPGEELTILGYETNGVAVTVPVNAYGYFGVRVPIGLEEKTITYVPRNATANIAPFDSAVIADEDTGRADLDKALPNELFFPIMNMTVKQTVASAKAAAERDGKAMLLLCGSVGSDYMKPLTDYISYLDEVTDISNKFVYVVVSSTSSDWNELDGDPVIGIFDPAAFDVNERWKESNGRLDYANFLDTDATGESDDNVLIYTPDDTGPMTNRVDVLLEVGYDRYLRRHSGISVTVRGANLATGTFGDVATASPDYGTIENFWTNGEFAVFTASGAYTNESAGEIYSCVGWTTNEVTGISALTNYTAGAEAQIQLFADDEIVLTWVWDVSHYRVTASPTLSYTVDGAEGAVTPSNSWVAVGTRTTITAQPTLGQYHFWYWDVKGKVDYDPASMCENGTAVSFFVYEPVTVKANYARGTTGAPSVKTNKVTFVSSPAEIADVVPPPVAGGFDWGENITFDNVLQLQLASCVDSTGGVWMCTNVVVSGIERISETSSGIVISGDSLEMAAWRFDPRFDITVTCEWVPYSTEGPYTPPAPPLPVPTAIAITGLAQTAVGTWDITISGAVKGCWYWLYSTDNLSNFAGDEATWTAAADFVEKKQAAADGDVEFSNLNGNAAGAALFWRARATSTEGGN